jgi:1-acyl-sn-glycerol-3-phosphate acyltransferase
MSAILRSLLFYLVFYSASVLFVSAAAIASLAGGGGVLIVGRGWSGFHRRCVRVLLGIRVREEGHRPAGPVLYAIRHESFFEAIDLPHFLDRPVVFAKEELFRIPGWGFVSARYGLIPVARDKGASGLRAMLGAARGYSATGRPLVIFPEGTRIPHGQRGKLQAGFAALYKLLALPVVPVAVDSGPLYHRWWKRSGTITLRIGEPIPPGLPREEIEARVLDAINVLNREHRA